jgi:cold shock CspA family protein
MTQGTIKNVRDDRGFGFIRPDGETQDNAMCNFS